MQRIKIIDSHTGGEPTRVIVAGGPRPGVGSLVEQRAELEAKHDHIRSAVINEPRGSDVIVGALLTEPVNPGSTAGVIFFNNTGYLNMCGHGMIGVVVTLAYLGRITSGTHKIDTAVGTVTAVLHDRNRVTIQNVPSYRWKKSVRLELADATVVTGDVAWGGNWFFLAQEEHLRLHPDNLPQLLQKTKRIRTALEHNHIAGRDGDVIDHIELIGTSDTGTHGRSFVLCPGSAWDRSPCGTGTSSKMACLAADGQLDEGETWRQESIVGSVFEGSYRFSGDRLNGEPVVIPSITGSAWVTAEGQLLLHESDPFRHGIQL